LGRLLYVAVRHGGYGLADAVRQMGGLKYQAAAQGVKRVEARLTKDAQCRRFVNRLAAKMSNIGSAAKRGVFQQGVKQCFGTGLGADT